MFSSDFFGDTGDLVEEGGVGYEVLRGSSGRKVVAGSVGYDVLGGSGG
jgi:hypothetical protein